MAKAASPVRLEKELMEAASRSGERLHRSAAEQVEYWADIGRTVDASVSPDTLLEVATGLARLKVERVIATPVDPVDVFARLERDRNNGRLAESVAGGGVRYQASRQFPGQLERIDAEGQVTVGEFENGEFTAIAGSAPAAQA
jgi:hypothetical protein